VPHHPIENRSENFRSVEIPIHHSLSSPSASHYARAMLTHAVESVCVG
jgi:hypothetical protein